MKEYAQKPENTSRSLSIQSKAANQASTSEMLQAYKNKMLGNKPAQRQSIGDEELLQAKAAEQARFNAVFQRHVGNVQRYATAEKDKPIQGKFDTAQREENKNNTGLPDSLKTGVENLSGYSMDDVKVHYNSDKPAQLNALAYTQGTDIHVAPGQENYLPHEAWHVVQQMQGRVQPTMQLQGVNVNDNEGLEREADVMGEVVQQKKAGNYNSDIVQRVTPVKLQKQTGGNCGLFCIKMAIEALGGNFSASAYDDAAEKSGSNVGEIFDFDTMKKIVEKFNSTATKIEFTDSITLLNALTASGTNPVLIAFSNIHFMNKATDSVSKTKGYTGTATIDTQAGHWSIIYKFDDITASIANPWGKEFTIPLTDLAEANKKLGSTPGATKPEFDWGAFVGTGKTMSPMDPTNGNYILNKATPDIKVTGGLNNITKTITNGKQPLDLKGYIVVISKRVY